MKTRIIANQGIYPPSEDSELLAQSLTIPKNAVCLDLGCGTGIQGITMALLGAKSVTFCDQNPLALENAKQNKKLNHLTCETKFIQSDLFENISEKFDVITFNPPYVPSEKIKWIDTDGGKKGRIVLDRFLDKIEKHLKPNGQVFFLQTSLNETNPTEKKLKQNGFEFEIVNKQKLFFEELLVYRCWKN